MDKQEDNISMTTQDLINKIEETLQSTGSINSIFRPLADLHLQEKNDTSKSAKIKDCWYATDLGGCLSGSYFSRLTPQKSITDSRTLSIFDMGKMVHDYLEQIAEDAGILVAKEDALHIIDEKNGARGRGDLLIKVGKYYIIYDIKSMHHEAFWWMAKSGFDAKYHHKMQLHFYMRALREKYPDLLGAILYVSRSDMTMQETAVKYDESIIEDIDRQFGILNKAWEEKKPPEPPPSVIFNAEMNRYEVNWVAKYCAYHHLCTNNPSWLEEAKKEVAAKNKISKTEKIKF